MAYPTWYPADEIPMIAPCLGDTVPMCASRIHLNVSGVAWAAVSEACAYSCDPQAIEAGVECVDVMADRGKVRLTASAMLGYGAPDASGNGLFELREGSEYTARMLPTGELRVHETVSADTAIIPFVVALVLVLAGILAMAISKRHSERSAQRLGGHGGDGSEPLAAPLVAQEDAGASKAALADGGGDVEVALAAAPPALPKKPRLKSLDAMRGLSLTFMLFANFGGGGYVKLLSLLSLLSLLLLLLLQLLRRLRTTSTTTTTTPTTTPTTTTTNSLASRLSPRYPFLDHSLWHGLTVADLLFPWFMWIGGASMAYSLHGQARRGTPRGELLRATGTRAARLVALGLFLNNGDPLRQWRFPGVLQYFGVAQFAVSWTALIMSWDRMAAPAAAADAPIPSPLQELWACRSELPIVGGAAALWLLVTFAGKAPGCPRGYIGPGGISDHGDHSECVGGTHKWVDVSVFGEGHIYDEPTCTTVYQCGVYDPEGLVGALNAIVLCWLGLYVGRALRAQREHDGRIRRLLVVGTSLLMLTAVLGGVSLGPNPSPWASVPINKNLWSTSFVLVTAGTGCWLLAGLYYVIDLKQSWAGAPFFQMGMNSIVVYAGSGVFEEYFPFRVQWSDSPSHVQALVSNIIGISVWMGIACWLFNKKIFVKV